MIFETLKMAIKSLRKRKTRSALTITGISIAIFTIFVLLSLSIGLTEVVNEQFQILGGNKFFIQTKGSIAGMSGADSPIKMTLDDIDVLEKVNGVDIVTYFTMGNAKLEYHDETRYFYVIGMPLDNELGLEVMFESMNLGVESGRILKKGDKGKVMVGYNYKYRNVFDNPVSVGNKIKINGVDFEVIGVVDKVGNPGDDQQIYLGWEDDFRELFGSGDRVDYIMVQIKEGEDIKEVADRAEKKLIKSRDLTTETFDLTILTPEQLLETFSNILNILTFFLIGIAVISLVVGGIGIANTMYTSVLERRKDIGTMKAIGARNEDILAIFVSESGLLGLIGGVIGLILGITVAKGVEYVAAVYAGLDLIRASMNPLLMIGSVAFALLIGLTSGLLPSYQASKLEPADALRYE